jgi:cysteinyl-tRNA synthetase
MRLSAVLLLLWIPLGVVGAQVPALDTVSNWLYLIDVNLDEATVALIAESDYDMVVIDFITSEAANEDYPLADVIARWHNAAHPKLVIAYIDVGQAESYRTYWQEGWGIGNPDWIISEDPDGWDENYPVAYWYDEWRAIWMEEGGYLDQINAAGFDGVYLDWVEAYSDYAVADFAAAEGVDPVQEMIWWVEDIAVTLRKTNPDSIVIAQNAAELAYYPDYVDTIDAIAQEQVWFDGGADNEPPGDCPLPRTEDDIDSAAYVNGLSTACRVQYDEFPESTLHVSSEWYIEDLQVAQAQGLPIFTVDYALDPANIAWTYETSRGYGFVPFVSNRGLDQFVPVYVE